MRPSTLDLLFAPAGPLPGIGPKNAKLFDGLPGARWITDMRMDGGEVKPI
jgi:hypothetical protein